MQSNTLEYKMKKKIVWTIIVIVIIALCVSFYSHSHAKKKNSSVISVWLLGETSQDMQPFIDQFEKENPTLTVDVQYVPWTEAYTKIITAVLAGTTPDVMSIGTTWLPQFQDYGIFQDLTPYINSPNSCVKYSDFPAGAMQANTFNGELSALPWDLSSRVVIYRKDILAKYGYTSFPTTWPEYLAMCEKLKADGVKYPVMQATGGGDSFFQLLQNMNSGLVSPSGASLVMTPQFQTAAKFWLSWFSSGVSPISLSLDWSEQFVSGDMPIIMDNPGRVNEILTDAQGNGVADMASKIGVAMMPGWGNSDLATLNGADLVMFKKSQNKENAYKFISFMCSPGPEITYATMQNNVPTNMQAWKDFPATPVNLVVEAQMKNSFMPLNVPENQALQNELGNAFNYILYKKMTFDQGMQYLNTKVNTIMKRGNM